MDELIDLLMETPMLYVTVSDMLPNMFSNMFWRVLIRHDSYSKLLLKHNTRVVRRFRIAQNGPRPVRSAGEVDLASLGIHSRVVVRC